MPVRQSMVCGQWIQVSCILKALDNSTEAEDSGEDNEEDLLSEDDLFSEDDCDTEADVGGTFSRGSD